MSLFDSSGADIWSMGAFPEESSLKDLLETGIFTLEQLLCEDELLQELKGLHPQLVTYLSKPHICRELIGYLTCTSNQEPLSEEDELNLNLKYPYIACEIICCEVSVIVDTIADGYVDDDPQSILEVSSVGSQEYDSLESNHGSHDGLNSNHSENGDFEQNKIRILDSLFDLSLLATKNKSDQKQSSDLMTDETLLDKDYTVDDRLAGYLEKVISILFKLRPTAIATYLNKNGDRLLPLFFKHISSYSVSQILQRLLVPADNNSNKFNGESLDPPLSTPTPKMYPWIDDDTTLNLLLQHTIISQTSHSSLEKLDEIAHCTEILIALLQSSNSPLERLIAPDIFSKILSPFTQIPERYTPSESHLTHNLHLLEAMLLQLGGFGMHNRPTKEIKLTILPFVPQIIKSLRNILSHPATKTWKLKSQMKHDIPQVGIPRLRGIRVLEALVLLGEEEIDEILLSNDNGAGDIIGLSCDLFWEMEWCSGLHQSIANMIVHVFEGKNKRHLIQDYLINKYNIIEKLLHVFQRNEESYKEKRLRLGNIGHSIIICQAINNVENAKKNTQIKKEEAGEVSKSGIIDKAEPTNSNKVCENKIDEDINALTQAISEVTIESHEENTNLADSDASSNNITRDTNTTSEMSQNIDSCDMNSLAKVSESISSTKTSTEDDKIIVDSKDSATSDTSSNSSPTTSELSSNALPSTESSQLIGYLQKHPLYEQWSSFRATTLSLIIEQQTTTLGGKFLCSLEITENEIDIAASMMGAGFSDPSIDNLRDLNGQMDYFYNDPLGRKPDADLDIKSEKYQEDNYDDDDDIKDVQVIDLFVKKYDMENEDTSKNTFEYDDTVDSNSIGITKDKQKDVGNDKVTDITLETKGENLDTSWANFADFETVPVENTSEDKHSSLQLSSSQEDFFANFGEMDNGVASLNLNDDCFFDADFSSFPTSTDNTLFEENEDSVRNGNEKIMSTEPSKNLKNDEDKVKTFIDFESSSQHINETEHTDVEEIVGDLFTRSGDKSVGVDPFVDMGHRRQSIDELF